MILNTCLMKGLRDCFLGPSFFSLMKKARSLCGFHILKSNDRFGIMYAVYVFL